MKTTFSKISISFTLVVFAFGVFGYVTSTDVFVNQAEAVVGGSGGCGSCGGGTDTSGGGGGGGGITTLPPTCDITTNISSVAGGSQYTITWVGVGTGATFKVNNATVAARNSVTYTFNPANLTERFVFTGTNAGGSCRDEVVVSKIVTPPTCDIRANVTAVRAGDTYLISWTGTPANGATFKVNGTVVAANDSATYTFNNINNTEKFTFTGTNTGGTCTDVVTVTKTVDPIKTCDLTASATSVAAGGSLTLNWSTTGFTEVKINGVVVALDGSKTYTNLQANTTYTLIARTADGTGTCTKAVTVTCVLPVVPSCTLNANPTSVVAGGSSNLSWTSQNAVSASLNQSIGSVSVNGNRNVTPNETTTYTLMVTNSAGATATCTKTITVNPVVVPAPTCELNANPTSINAGNSSTLTWTSQHGVSATLNNDTVSLNGNRSVNPSNTTTYTFIVTNSAGVTATCSKTITVIPQPEAPVCNSFTASPATINRGNSSTLTWNTSNSDSVTINNGIGSKSSDGSFEVSPLETTMYTLTVLGTNNQRVTCQREVVVIQPSVFTCSNNVNFSASDSSITEGDNTTLTWTTTGARTVSINGVNSNALDGSEVVSPNNSTTYTLTATNNDNKTISCPVTVNVSPRSHGGGGGGTPSPRCTLKISDNSITKGERVTLTWDTTSATEVTLKDNYSKILVTTDDRTSSQKKELYDGEITLRPERDTTYTLLAERGSKDKTCTVKVSVKDGVTVLQTRDQQPVVSGIALTQVPYTGFEAGPFLTTLFYALLAMFAAYLAYIFVIRRDGTLVASSVAVLSDHVHTAQVFAKPTSFAPNFHKVPEPVVAASTAVVGYAAAVATEVSGIEAMAHAAGVLLSADALAQLAALTNDANVASFTTTVFEKAKATYPSEDGYVAVGLERLNSILS